MLFAGLLLIAYQYIFRRHRFKVGLVHLLPLFVLGLVSIYITNIAEIWGLQYMSSSKACLIYSLSPFVAALFAYFLLKERLSTKKWIGLLVGFIGIMPLLLIDSALDGLSKEIFVLSRGDISLIIAVFASVYGWILLKKILQEFQYSPILANGCAMTIGGIFALFHSYLSGEHWSPIPIIDNQYGAYIECALWMTLISNIICYNLYGFLLKRFSATFMSLAGLVTPLFAAFFGWYFLNEEITWHYFASMVIFSIGLVVFYQEEIQANFDTSIGPKEASS